MPERDGSLDFETRQIHAGAVIDAQTNARVTPIYQTAGYVFSDFDDGEERFAGQSGFRAYSRNENPTNAVAGKRLADLEGGVDGIVVSSGQAAIAATLFALAQAGDHILATRSLYEGTREMFRGALRRQGLDVEYVPDDADESEWAARVTPRTKAVYTETIPNPLNQVVDLERLAGIAHRAGVPLVVDSTVATPYLCRPIEWGADIVTHSATKFLGGHGTTLGGVVVESGRFDWSNHRFPLFDEPVPHYGGLNWYGNFGEYAFLTRLRSEQLRDIGPVLSATSAAALAQGIETLPYRIQAHVDNARAVAEWLRDDPRIEYVNWAGLEGHPHHDRAKKYLGGNPGSVFGFGLRSSGTAGGREVGQKFIESVELASHVANIGDAKTLVIHPASTTHAQLTEQQLIDGGVGAGLIRISVGIEDVDDIIYDIDQAIDAALKGAE